ncbi:hypothetical protein [Pseudoalteromonas tunicata]|nr:hypothetical protein [Pseudoalteromonas tunicata]
MHTHHQAHGDAARHQELIEFITARYHSHPRLNLDLIDVYVVMYHDTI